MLRLIKSVLNCLGLWYIPPINITPEETHRLHTAALKLEAAEMTLKGTPFNIEEALKQYINTRLEYNKAWNEVRETYNLRNKKLKLDIKENKLYVV